MSRRTKPLECSKSDVLELQRLAEDSSNPRAAERARMILECAKGLQIKEVAAMFSERPNTVIKWKRRYEEMGISGLLNAPRGSTKDIYGEPFARRLREMLENTPPNGEKYWTGPLLAEALGTPNDTIRRYLRRENIQLLEYRRHVRDDGMHAEQGETYDQDCEVAAPAHEENDDLRRNAAILQTDAKTVEKHISVCIASVENLHDAMDGLLDVEISVRLMDQNGCVQENHFSFPEALPHLGQFNVTALDTL